jgi:hypothetical protein
MTTKAEITAKLKAEYPVLKVGNDDEGYTELDAKAYETKIAQWADAAYAEEIAKAEAEAKEVKKQAVLAKLGLTSEEIDALLK